MPPKPDPVIVKGKDDKTPAMATGGAPVTLEALMAAITRMQADQNAALQDQANATQALRQEIQNQGVAVHNQGNAIQLLQAAIPPPPDPNQGQNPPVQQQQGLYI